MSPEKLERRLASYISLYIGLCSTCPEQPTNHSTRSTQEGEGRGEWQFPVGTSAWLESTQLPCQYPPAHQVIQYTYTLWVHVLPLVSVDQHTLMGFLRGYKGTEEGLEKEWEALVPRNSLNASALCFTSIKGLLTTNRPKKVSDMHPWQWTYHCKISSNEKVTTEVLITALCLFQWQLEEYFKLHRYQNQGYFKVTSFP